MRFFAFFLTLILAACQAQAPHNTQVKIGDTTVNAKISDTDATRIRGLQFVTHLPENQGMLFIYEQPHALTHWMKDMRIPLDMIWIDAHKKVLNISSNVSVCKAVPCAVYASKGAAKYVLEVNAGFAADHHIQPGTEVFFDA